MENPRFQFVGGTLALDFVNTVGNWRHAPTRRDYFAAPGNALDWLVAAGLEGDRASAGRLSARQFRRLLDVRARLYRIFASLADGRAPAPADVASLDRLAASARAAQHLARDGDGFVWRWKASVPWDRALFRIAIDAADLLVSDDRRSVRQCADGQCGWLFLDRSRGGRRRWCSMADCGNRAKARAHYNRVKASGG